MIENINLNIFFEKNPKAIEAIKVVNNTEKLIRNRNSKYSNFCINNIPENDERVLSLFSGGITDNIYGYDSEETKIILQLVNPIKFTDLIAIYALCKPPISFISIAKFICAKNGNMDNCLCQYVNEICDETYGMIVYSEQIIKIINSLSGYPIKEAIIFQKETSKLKYENTKKQIDKFYNYALTIGLTKEKTDKIIEIAYYSPECSKKSDSIPYAILGYQMGYLKKYFNDEFEITIEDIFKD